MVSFSVFTSCSKGLFWRFGGMPPTPSLGYPYLVQVNAEYQSPYEWHSLLTSVRLYVSQCWPWKQLFLKLPIYLRTHLIAIINFTALTGRTSYKVSQIINIFLLKCIKVLTQELSCAGNPQLRSLESMSTDRGMTKFTRAIKNKKDSKSAGQLR
jgi:hypothetical protein